MTVLSAILIAKNEEKNIAECLDSLSFTDEIIVVVDSQTCDRTKAIARKYSKKVFVADWKGYAETKQAALEKASGEWILWVDADERVTPELAMEIGRVLAENGPFSAFRVSRKAYFLGRWIKHGGWYPGWVVRLFRRDCAEFNRVRVHESLVVNGSIGDLKSPLIHYTDDSLNHYFRKFNEYTELAASDLLKSKRRFRLIGFLVRPLHMFVKMYFLRLGFLDGMEGFILAVLSAHYVFTKYAKLWELEKKQK